ncbi:phage tail protein [Hoeflea olei]|uniref:Phage tail protein n=1 Tax=Hoeflea olei TaxID=1480615 RepID=A0A1C1YTU7_9HYPH|nr:tail fiber protein [Hoeflea olei]OCW56914.1 phage tail protein [Hoeflea olei]
MADPYIGEIRMFAGNFAPRGWAFCDGQLLAISEYDALYALFGTIYGGDGRVTFGLPDLRGRVPIHQGTGPGLSIRRIGSRGGSERITLTSNQLPSHDHSFNGDTQEASDASPAGNVIAKGDNVNYLAASAPSGANAFAPTMVGSTGGSQSHSNLMPTLCVNFICSLFGIYPSQT